MGTHGAPCAYDVVTAGGEHNGLAPGHIAAMAVLGAGEAMGGFSPPVNTALSAYGQHPLGRIHPELIGEKTC